MDKSLLQRSFSCRVGLCGQSNQALFKNVGFQRLKASDHDVYSHVILVTSEKMGLWEVFAYKHAWTLGYVLLLSNDSDATSTAWGSWLHDIHVREPIGLPFLHPPFVVLRKKVCRWTYLEVFAILPPLPLAIPPEVAFMSKVPSPGKVIKLLERVHVLKLIGPYQPCPETVPGCPLWETESS